MINYNDVLQDCVNQDYDTLVAIAQKSLNTLAPIAEQHDAEHGGMLLLSSLVLTAVAADSTLTAMETRFLCDALKLDEPTVNEFISIYDDRMIALVKTFTSMLNDESTLAAFMLIAAVASCDETITREENMMIHNLFG